MLSFNIHLIIQVMVLIIKNLSVIYFPYFSTIIAIVAQFCLHVINIDVCIDAYL